MHWQSPVDKPENGRRERFSPPLAAVGIFCAFLAVLALLFPKQGLELILDKGDDAATRRYRESLLRVHPGDSGLRMEVALGLQHSGQYTRVLETLAPLRMAPLSPGQRLKVAELRYLALNAMLGKTRPHGPDWRRLRPEVIAAARELAGPATPTWRWRQLAADARQSGDMESWREYSLRAEPPSAPPPGPSDPFAAALARGDYRRAASLCFEQMQGSGNLVARRELFMRGVRTLQAGNLPQEAFAQGESHLGALAGDRATLIFLTRVGLSANQPARAQALIRRALGMRRESAS